MPDAAADDAPADRRRRERMVRDQLADIGDARVVAAMAALPRHAFVPERLRAAAYDDGALGIGGGATISQPRVVAAMLAALALRPGERTLDVGAGSGYAAALIAALTAPAPVIAIERLEALIGLARARLARRAPAVELRHGDGWAGAADAAPFAAIHIACACPEPPPALLDQLAADGRMVLPLGAADGIQRLTLLRRDGCGWRRETLMEVRFVPALPGLG